MFQTTVARPVSFTGVGLHSGRDVQIKFQPAPVDSGIVFFAHTSSGVRRIHPEPEPEKLDEFTLFVAALLKRMPGDLTNRKVCNEFLDHLPDDHRKYVITANFLRAMARASYSPDPGLHYGLGKTRYSHFTSPIRRYSDLALHQQLHAAAENTRLRSKKHLPRSPWNVPSARNGTMKPISPQTTA